MSGQNDGGGTTGNAIVVLLDIVVEVWIKTLSKY